LSSSRKAKRRIKKNISIKSGNSSSQLKIYKRREPMRRATIRASSMKMSQKLRGSIKPSFSKAMKVGSKRRNNWSLTLKNC
jgi:hypothetical protein